MNLNVITDTRAHWDMDAYGINFFGSYYHEKGITALEELKECCKNVGISTPISENSMWDGRIDEFGVPFYIFLKTPKDIPSEKGKGVRFTDIFYDSRYQDESSLEEDRELFRDIIINFVTEGGMISEHGDVLYDYVFFVWDKPIETFPFPELIKMFKLLDDGHTFVKRTEVKEV